MKKFIAVFPIILLLSLNINPLSSIAQPEAKSFTQGLYKVKDTDLLTRSSYKIKNTSPTFKVIVQIFDESLAMQEFIFLEPNSPEYTIKPLDFDYTLVIIGNGNVVLS
ncbi:hypothetical protein [uncultured Clostridium sp.]|uniref:hypothetical protein n=1 Tax=uncultured Clostridium sp. TaxID=59620 RepID=UPI0028E36E62|nr:hypothetical protein [uncultured Clostridium sp.]